MDREHDADERRSGPHAVAIPHPYGPGGLLLSVIGIGVVALLLCAATAVVIMVVTTSRLGADGVGDLIQELKFDMRLQERLSAAVVSVIYLGLAASTIAAAGLRGGRGWRDLVALRPIRAGRGAWRDTLGIGVVTLAYIALATYALEHARDHTLVPSGPTDVLLIGTLVANLVLFAPLAEELLFRGWIYTALRHRFSFWPSFLITLVAFAAIHFDPHHPRVVQVLPLAAALGLMRERAGSIKPTIALHAIYNLVIIAIRLAYT